MMGMIRVVKKKENVNDDDNINDIDENYDDDDDDSDHKIRYDKFCRLCKL